MTVVVPDSLSVTDAALVYIHGGNKNSDPPNPEQDTPSRIVKFALRTGAVAASINNIPHQPITFTDDMLPRVEDDIIASTWRYLIEGVVDDTDANLLFPMTRAARRAADTVIDFTNLLDRRLNITHIMPSGRSKRGWTTWLLGCVDQRVFSLSPIVLDLLNWHDNLHHFQAYGGWSWDENIPRYINNSMSAEIFEDMAIDLLSYNERLSNRPKIMILRTADEFFLLDDAHYFYEDLLGLKFIQMMENGDHGFSQHLDRQWKNLENFFLQSYTSPEGFPSFTWVRTDDELNRGTLEMTIISGNVRYARGWVADTSNVTIEIDEEGNEIHCQNFRQNILGPTNPVLFVEAEVAVDGNTYQLAFTRPNVGYRAFFIEVSFEGRESGN